MAQPTRPELLHMLHVLVKVFNKPQEVLDTQDAKLEAFVAIEQARDMLKREKGN